MNNIVDPSINSQIWQRLYSEGKNDLHYPNDIFIRLCNRIMNEKINKVLDCGFGTGANLIHLAKKGYEVSGVEISSDAIEKTTIRLHENNLQAELK